MMNDNYIEQGAYEVSERFSQELERDARRYNKAFTEEEEVRLI